jgi:hypothetical protein
MTHHLCRQGLRMTGLDFDQDHLQVAEALNRTYGLSARLEQCSFHDFRPQGAYDVVLALTVLCHMFFRQSEMSTEAILAKLDSFTAHAMFWESGREPLREIDLIRAHTGLTQYLSLGPTYGTGKHRELGLFLRPGTELSRRLLHQYETRWPGMV